MARTKINREKKANSATSNDAGQSTLVERVLLYSTASLRISGQAQDNAMDWMVIERGIMVQYPPYQGLVNAPRYKK